MSQRDDLFGSIVPKSIVGLAIWVLMFALGASVSGIIFFAIYQARINTLEDRVIKVEQSVDKQVDAKLKDLEKQLEELKEGQSNLRVSSSDAERLAQSVGPSIAKVEGLDANKAPTRGSGFVVKTTGSEAWVITNHHLVAGAALQNLPVRIRIGATELDSGVYATDPGRDLALVIFRNPGGRALRFTRDEAKKDAEVWAVGIKPNAFSVTATKGKVVEAGPLTLLTDADIQAATSGGPLLDSSGNVVGVISVRDVPSGPNASYKRVVPIRQVCSVVLRCPAATSSTATPTPSKTGSPRAGSPPTPPPSPAAPTPVETGPPADALLPG